MKSPSTLNVACLVASFVALSCGGSDESSGSGGKAGTSGSSGSRGDAAGGTNAGGNGATGGTAGSAGAAGGAGGARASGGSGGAVGGSGGAAGGEDGGGGSGGTAGSSGAVCAPLPPPGGATIEVNPAQSAALPGIVLGANPGTTILLADGTYTMSGDEASRRLQFATSGVTLRSASGNRDSVVIDGEYVTNEIINVSASDVTIADVTIKRAVQHPIHVVGSASANVTGVKLYNLHIIDGGSHFIKVNTSGQTSNTFVDNGTLECSLLEMSDEGRTHVRAAGTNPCYTGGIDAHQARGWIVRQNVVRGIYCTNGLADGAIFFWTGSRDTVVEQNVVVDCARGILFGLGDSYPGRAYPDNPYPGFSVAHYDGIIRNNFVYAAISQYSIGIGLESARGAKVLHNTVVHSADKASLDYRFSSTLVDLDNNIVRALRQRDGGQATLGTNLETNDTSLFADSANADLHLVASATAAVDQGSVLPLAGDDIDGQPHTVGAPDLGADEYRAP